MVCYTGIIYIIYIFITMYVLQIHTIYTYIVWV